MNICQWKGSWVLMCLPKRTLFVGSAEFVAGRQARVIGHYEM